MMIEAGHIFIFGELMGNDDDDDAYDVSYYYGSSAKRNDQSVIFFQKCHCSRQPSLACTKWQLAMPFICHALISA